MSHRWPAVNTSIRRTAPTASQRPLNIASVTGLTPPPPGRAVLACRCGTMLDLDDMHRPDCLPDRARSDMRIDPISCARCARESITGL